MLHPWTLSATILSRKPFAEGTSPLSYEECMHPELSVAQYALLKSDAESPANASALSVFIANNDDQAIAEWYNTLVSPPYWVWLNSLERKTILYTTSVDGTTFDFTGTGFITRSVGERDAWREIFADGNCNASLASIRKAMADIFSGGTPPAPANRIHLLASARRAARRAEQLFAIVATGVGNNAADARGATTNPDAMPTEGVLTYLEVARALRNVGV